MFIKLYAGHHLVSPVKSGTTPTKAQTGPAKNNAQVIRLSPKIIRIARSIVPTLHFIFFSIIKFV